MTPSGGSVTSVGITAPTAGITVSGGPVTGSGSITLALGDDLAAVEGLATTGGVERTGANTWSTYTLSAAGKDLIDDADATAQRTTLGLGSLAIASAVAGGTAGTITDDSITNADINSAAAIDASKIANGTVSSTEFQYLDGVTSSVQTQLDAKANAANPTFTGVLSTALGSAAAPSYSFTGDPNTGVWSAADDTVNVSTGGSERLRVTSTGNVGIGTNGTNLIFVKKFFAVS